ncbi:MAG: CBS domain-containing protein [Thermoleophilia bacterium]|jgi:tRNA nucleotidyltransferase (CCA-adding enzyme)|nr:CBS domain-containing protein [Thermoleophilia bacterium]
MRPRELIATHSNTDFDGFAGMVAAHKLYPEAHICLGGAVNRNVREFQALYADLVPAVDPVALDLEEVERLILVDTTHANRIGDLGSLCGRDGVQVVAFDHHGEERPPYLSDEHLVRSDDGSIVTLLLRIVGERGIPVTPFEASLFAIGIHEDTGSLTFSTTTEHDAEALAFCMRHGADPVLIERWLTNALTPGQRSTLAAALEGAEEHEAGGRRVLLAAVARDDYVEGVSVVAHRVMDLTACDAFVLLVEMEERVFATARSRGGGVDVAAVLAPIGGGGHSAASSAVLKDQPLAAARAAGLAALPGAVTPAPSAAQVMTPGLPAVDAASSVDDALIACRRQGLDGLAVTKDGVVAGSVGLVDLERALGHGLGHAPVKAVMTARLPAVASATAVERAAEAIVDGGLGWAAVVGDGASHPPRREDVLGIVSRRLFAREQAAPAEPAPEVAGNVAGRLAELGLDELFAHVQALAGDVRGVYLVGGAVRDLLLGERSFDIDLAVEGDGIAFAEALAARLHGHVRAHRKFGTAVVVTSRRAPHVDVASTRSESYEYPAALPKVEHAGIRSDLARRDFTINAMAVALQPDLFGALLDPFGGLSDLQAERIVVLHNLSFIEDPTRILRALRYETRYGLRMDEHTLGLARACAGMDLIGDLSSARLRDELVVLLDEEKIEFALERLEDLGLEEAVHARFRAGARERALVRRGDEVVRRHHLEREIPRWRLRLLLLLLELEPEEIAAWARRMRVRRRDADVLERGHLVARRVVRRLASGPGEAELAELLRHEPLEAAVLAIVLGESVAAPSRVGHYLDVTRHVRLEIGGEDLLALGLSRGPRVGEVLASVLRLKVNGTVAGRDEELAAARRLL